MKKIKEFFIKLKPSRRKIIQLYSALLYNAHLKGFVTGKIFTGKTKGMCLPSMNCYSCPGAVGACPLGSLQNSLSESKTKTPTYILGIILLYCIIFGRTICGFLCPVGFFQELLYKIKTPKLKKSKVTRVLSYFKYVLLAVFVIGIPLIYGLQKMSIPLPGFCKYICPVGTFEGTMFLLINPNNREYYTMLGSLFTWKFTLLIIFIVASIFIFRFFCRFFCPLGAIYGLFNKLSIVGIHVDKSKCDNCGVCVSKCKMDVRHVGDHECIMCGECVSSCHANAISFNRFNKLVKGNVSSAPVNEAIENKAEENKTEVENKEVKATKKNKRNTINMISFIVATVALILALVYFNIDNSKKFYKLNDTVNDYSFKLVEGNKYEINNENDKFVIIYFYDQIDNDTLANLNNYSTDEIDVVIVSSYASKDNEIDLNTYNNVYLAYDSVNSISLLEFSPELSYPYLAVLNKEHKVIIKQNRLLSEWQYNSFNYDVGNEVGNLCINSEINMIGSNEPYSIEKNIGKIQIINFWGKWCTPCVNEIKEGVFNQACLDYDNVVAFAIHTGDDYDSTVDDFVNQNWSDYTMQFGYDDPENSYYMALIGTSTWPATIIVDEDGIIRYKVITPLTYDEIKTMIDSIIND